MGHRVLYKSYCAQLYINFVYPLPDYLNAYGFTKPLHSCHENILISVSKANVMTHNEGMSRPVIL